MQYLIVPSKTANKQGFQQFLLSSRHVCESTGRDIFLVSQGAFRALKA